MGLIIEYKNLPKMQDVYRLVVYCSAPSDTVSTAVSINKELAAELIKYKPARRTMQLEKCFSDVMEKLSFQPVIKEIDVMFNPNYKVDVMKVLISVNKRKPYSLIWPGSYSDGKLIYSEKGYLDYKEYSVFDYDIVCVV